MALSKIQAESMNLADTFAFTGTVTGAGVSGKVLQVVMGTSDEQFSTSNTTFTTNTTGTRLRAIITPSSTDSEILITLHGTIYTQQYTRNLYLDIARSFDGTTTNIISTNSNYTAGDGLLRYYVNGAGAPILMNGVITYLDAPNTTSTCVYEPALKYGGGNTPPAYFGQDNVLQTIIAMEIAN